MSSTQTAKANQLVDTGTVAGWSPTTTNLRYSLNYIKLFEVRFKALIDPRMFDPDRDRVTSVVPRVEDVPAGYDVLVQRNPLAFGGQSGPV